MDLYLMTMPNYAYDIIIGCGISVRGPGNFCWWFKFYWKMNIVTTGFTNEMFVHTI